MNNTFEWVFWRDVALTYRTVMNFRMLFVYKVHILKKADTIITFCIMKMLKKRIRCISVLVQLFVQWYLSCINITTARKIVERDKMDTLAYTNTWPLTLLSQSNVSSCRLFTWKKNMHYCIISLRGDVWAH
jgi:hypothetical protein